MKNIIFGSTSLIGQELYNQLRLSRKKFFFCSRKNYLNQNNWIKYNLSNIRYALPKKFNIGIFLISTKYLKKKLKKKTLLTELKLLKEVSKNCKFEKFIYLSSSTVYQKNNLIGKIKKKCESYLKKNKNFYNKLQIWRPYNLVGKNKLFLSDHFYNLLFKKMFLDKRKGYLFNGHSKDKRGYCSVKIFAKNLIKYSKKNINFSYSYGNKNSVNIYEIADIFNRRFYKLNKKYFNVKFKNKIPNKNLINAKSNKSIVTKENNKKLFNTFLNLMLKDLKKN